MPQRYARGGNHDGVAQSGVRAEPFAAWLDNWSLRSTVAGWLPLRAVFSEGDMGFELRLESDQPLVLQGDSGFSQKHPSGSGSYYYSQPFLRAQGKLMVNGEEIPVTGQAWLDREWSSQFLQPGQVGWDWFALHLDSGEKLMLFRLRQDSSSGSANGTASGSAGEYRHGVLLSPTGRKTPLDSQQIEFEVTAYMRLHGRRLPAEWRIRLPEVGRELYIRPLIEDQWMDVDFAYWEGAIVVSGDSPETRGRGYLEMTGYITD
jgi:predicted secreted hydrolase